MFKFVTGIVHFWGKAQTGVVAIPLVIAGVASLAVAGTVGAVVMSSGAQASDSVQQQTQDAINGIEGTMMVKGSTIAKASTTGSKGTIGQIEFTMGLVIPGGSVDFTPPDPSPENNGLAAPNSNNLIFISYTDRNQRVDNLYWTLRKMGRNINGNLLEGNQLYTVTIGGSATPGQNGGNLVDALSIPLSTYTDFTIELNTPQGIAYSFDRTTPGSINKVINFGY
jgi:hypothetical protein